MSQVAATTCVASKPTGTVADDLMIAVQVSDAAGNLAAMTAPSGWDLLAQFSGASRTPYVKVWQKVATASEPSSYSFPDSASARCSVGIITLYDQDRTVPLAVTPVANQSNVNTTSHTAPSVNGVAGGMLVVAACADTNGTTRSYTPPSGMTERIDTAQSTSGYTALEISTLALGASGATGTKTATCSGSTAYVALALVVAPRGGTATTVLGVSSAVGGERGRFGAVTTALTTGGAPLGQHVSSGPTTAGLAVASTPVGSKRRTASSTTALDLTTVTIRQYPTFHQLGLTSAVTGTKAVPVQVATNVNAAPTFATVHTSGSHCVQALGVIDVPVFARHVITPVNVTTALDLTFGSVVHQGGGTEPPPIVYDSAVRAYVPDTGRPLRFIAQDIVSGIIRNWDVPFTNVEITYTLSGPTVLRATLGPEYREAEEMRFDAWATWIHVEQNGRIRASLIVQPLAVTGQDLEVEAVGFTAYPNGIPFMGEMVEINIDPAEVVRRIWAHLQSFPDAKLGVTLDATATPIKLGTPVTYENTETGSVVITKTANTEHTATDIVRIEQGRISQSVYTRLALTYTPDTSSGTPTIYPTIGDVVAAKAALNDNTSTTARVVKKIDAKPYELAWWNERDCGDEINTLARAVPFDFAERADWNADCTHVLRHIQIGYPRLGTKRFDLRFAEDENLLEAVFARETPDTYASQVIVRGSGEGRDSVRGYAGGRSPRRLRRVVAVTDQAVKDALAANALAADELRRRLSVTSISEIVVDTTHDNAPIGSWALGDDILITARIPYIGDLSLWHRIIAYTWSPDSDRARLTVRRSDQFAYGRVVQ